VISSSLFYARFNGIQKLQKYADLGFTDIVLINSSPDRSRLIKLVSEQVAPAVGMQRSAAAQA
jgi:hypothetical protein